MELLVFDWVASFGAYRINPSTNFRPQFRTGVQLSFLQIKFGNLIGTRLQPGGSTATKTQPLQRFRGCWKPLKRLQGVAVTDTRLKPGANECPALNVNEPVNIGFGGGGSVRMLAR